MISLIKESESMITLSQYSNEAKKYNEIVEEEQKIIKQYCLIETGKTTSENFNSSLLPPGIDSKSELGLKLLRMISMLDITNQNLYRAYLAWEKIKKSHWMLQIYNSYYFTELRQMLIYSIHDLKYFVDQAISTVDYILNNESNYSVGIDCIGKYLNNNNQHRWVDDEVFLQKLNEIENAYKHSFTNDFNNLIGKHELCVFALANTRNSGTNIVYKEMRLKDVTSNFNKFYEKFKKKLTELTQGANQ